MNARLLLIPVLALSAAGCAEENPRHPTSAGATSGHGGRGTKGDPAARQQADDAITEATAKPATSQSSAATN